MDATAGVGSTLIVLYSMSYDAALLSRLPFMNHAAERGLSQIGALRAPGTRVVVVTPEPVAEEVLEYYLRDASGFSEDELPGIRARLELHRPRPDGDGALDARTLGDAELMAHLRKAVADSGSARLVNFAASAEGDELAAALGVAAEQAPAAHIRDMGGKLGGKRVLRLANVPTPGGPLERLHTPDEVIVACRDLAAEPDPPTRVALKLDDPKWGAGVGTVVLDLAAAVTGDLAGAVVKQAQPWPDVVADMAVGGAILEAFLLDVVASPSGQAAIDADGEVRVISTHDQLLDGDRYIGCVGPASAPLVERMREHLAATGKVLAGHGVRGTFGVDFIADTDGVLLATEINLRKVGPSHVTAHVADAASLDAHFVHHRVHEPAVLAHRTIGDVVEGLRSRGLLFDHTSRTGVLLHMLGAIPGCGYLETTAVESTRARAFDLDRRLRAALGLAPVDDPVRL